jgi:putative phosphoribosyl transferase
MTPPFADRRDAGRQLAEHLIQYIPDEVTVLGVPCGGVPVAYEIARSLGAPLDTFSVRSLMLADRSGISLGTIGSGGVRLLDRDVIYGTHVPPELVDHVTRAVRADLLAEEAAFRDDRPFPNVRGRTVILVDDGTSTGDVLWQSARLLRELDAARVALAVPSMARGDRAALEVIVEHVVSIIAPQLHDPRRWYADFTPATTGEVRALLTLAEVEQSARAAASAW